MFCETVCPLLLLIAARSVAGAKSRPISARPPNLVSQVIIKTSPIERLPSLEIAHPAFSAPLVEPRFHSLADQRRSSLPPAALGQTSFAVAVGNIGSLSHPSWALACPSGGGHWAHTGFFSLGRIEMLISMPGPILVTAIRCAVRSGLRTATALPGAYHTGTHSRMSPPSSLPALSCLPG